MNEQYSKREGGNMSKEHDLELEKPDMWDFERPEVREPVKASRVVVSVAFRRDNFEQVSRYAERIGQKTSEFIREAAIEKATGHTMAALVYGSGSTGAQWWTEQMPTNSWVSGLLVEEPEKTSVTTY
jgi:hypothetical protein